MEVKIDPKENRDQHCKFYIEKSLKEQIEQVCISEGISFSLAVRMFLIWGMQRGDF